MTQTWWTQPLGMLTPIDDGTIIGIGHLIENRYLTAENFYALSRANSVR